MLLAIFSGCGDSRPTTYPVRGSVEFGDGLPVTIGFVEFTPDEPGPSARGKLDSQGRFTIGTFENEDGAIPGRYQIVIVQHFTGGAAPPGQHEHAADALSVVIDTRYTQHDLSPLTATIEPKENNVRLRVERAKSKPNRK